MSVSIKWDEFKPVIRCVFHGDWTIEEFHLAAQAVEQMMSTVAYQVHTIIDMQDAAPPFCLPGADDAPHPVQANAGKLIFVGADGAEALFGDRLAELFCYPQKHLYFVQEMLEAERLLFRIPLKSSSNGESPIVWRL